MASQKAQQLIDENPVSTLRHHSPAAYMSRMSRMSRMT